VSAFNRFVEGLATMVILMLFLGGIQLIGMGLLGAYVGRTYEETKRRPKFIVDESLGFERPELASIGDARVSSAGDA
jgi:hypothetical protein